MSDIFISYAREDLDRVRSLAEALGAQGWSVSWDRTIPAGKTWRQFIGKALGEARCVLVVWSQASIESQWVLEEADEGRERGALIPIRLDDVKPPLGFRSIQGADLFAQDPGISSPEFERLVEDISALLGPSPALLRTQSEAKRLAGEEEHRKAEAETRKEAERKRLEAEAKRQAEKEERRRAEEEATHQREEAQRQKAEAEARRRIEEEEKQKTEAEALRKTREEQQRAEAETRRRADDERLKAEAKRRKIEEGQRKAEDEIRAQEEKYKIEGSVPRQQAAPGSAAQGLRYTKKAIIGSVFVVVVALLIWKAVDRPDDALPPTPSSLALDTPALPREVEHAPVESKGRTFIEPFTKMEFAWVPDGCYQMGCGSWSGACERNEHPLHDVCVDGYWIGKYEVTVAQFRQFIDETGYKGEGGNSYRCGKGMATPSDYPLKDDNPVTCVSYREATAFARWLTAKQKNAYTFRLPTEAEWEYSCRSGGKPQMFSGGDDLSLFAWHEENSGHALHKVGSKMPNSLGIYDMSGNAGELCADFFDFRAYSKHARNNPIVDTQDEGHIDIVERGGNFAWSAGNLRCSYRTVQTRSARASLTGFRLVAEERVNSQ